MRFISDMGTRQATFYAPADSRRPQAMIELTPIGRIESPLTQLRGAPKQGDEGAPDALLAIDPRAGRRAGVDEGDEGEGRRDGYQQREHVAATLPARLAVRRPGEGPAEPLRRD